MSDLKNTLIAVTLTIAIIFGWQFFYDRPRLKAKEKQAQAIKTQTILKQKELKKKKY